MHAQTSDKTQLVMVGHLRHPLCGPRRTVVSLGLCTVLPPGFMSTVDGERGLLEVSPKWFRSMASKVIAERRVQRLVEREAVEPGFDERATKIPEHRPPRGSNSLSPASQRALDKGGWRRNVERRPAMPELGATTATSVEASPRLVTLRARAARPSSRPGSRDAARGSTPEGSTARRPCPPSAQGRSGTSTMQSLTTHTHRSL